MGGALEPGLESEPDPPPALWVASLPWKPALGCSWNGRNLGLLPNTKRAGGAAFGLLGYGDMGRPRTTCDDLGRSGMSRDDQGLATFGPTKSFDAHQKFYRYNITYNGDVQRPERSVSI